ncbi:MFS transporter [Neisseriaceae bacterium CLB008]|nr:MFS transporter [Neisseriaceae bacterium]
MNPNPSAAGSVPNSNPALTKIYAKINLRLLPFLLLCYFFAYLDRVNIGFAKLQMQSDLGMSDAVYGFAAGIFFLGYVMFEVPSNLLLEKIGARKSIARIMVLWGLTSASMLFVTNETSFYILRFLLGVFEAGFAPGMIFYLTYWYSGARMARVMSIVMLAGPLGGMLGGPVSAWIMATMSDSTVMAGWQWLFLIEGLPCVFLGVMAFFYLDDKPGQAKWLSPTERTLLAQDIGQTKETSHHGFKTVLRDPWVYLLAFAYFCIISGIYAVAFWLPTLISNSGVTDLKQVGLYSAIPYLCAALFMWWFAKSSDKHQERRWHSTLPALFAAIGLSLAIVFGDHFAVSLAAISLATGLMWAAYTVFWAIPSQYLEGSAAAGGIALINSIGLLGGLVSPMLMGFVKEATGSLMAGWFSIAGVLALGALTLLFVAQKKKKA